MHAAPFKHLFGEQLLGSSEGLVGGAPAKEKKIKKAIDPSVTQFGSINTKRLEKKITILLDSCGNLGVNFVKDRVDEN